MTIDKQWNMDGLFMIDPEAHIVCVLTEDKARISSVHSFSMKEKAESEFLGFIENGAIVDNFELSDRGSGARIEVTECAVVIHPTGGYLLVPDSAIGN